MSKDACVFIYDMFCNTWFSQDFSTLFSSCFVVGSLTTGKCASGGPKLTLKFK